MNKPVSAALDWMSRASAQFSLSDVASFAFPPTFFAKAVKLAAAAAWGPGPQPTLDAADLGTRDPEFVRVVVDAFRALGSAYFRWNVEGVDHVPKAGPVLLVGNHNGGIVITDSFLTFVAIWDKFGPGRVLNGLAHDVAFRDPVLAKYARKFGALPAGHRSADLALDAGNLLLVYPGSDLDTYRPFRDRHRIVLGGRKGFLRLALRHQVPIVPVVSVGTHEQLIVLASGRRIARALGLKRLLRSEVLPIVLSVPWGLTVGFVPYIPVPAQTTLAFGKPIRFSDLGPDAAKDPAIVDRCYLEVERQMQALLDTTSEGRRPFVGRKKVPVAPAEAPAEPPAARARVAAPPFP